MWGAQTGTSSLTATRRGAGGSRRTIERSGEEDKFGTHRPRAPAYCPTEWRCPWRHPRCRSGVSVCCYPTMGGEDLHRLRRKSWGGSQDAPLRAPPLPRPPPLDLVERWLSCLSKGSSSPTDRLNIVELNDVTNHGGTCKVGGAVKERCAKSFNTLQSVCPRASTLRWECGGQRRDALQPYAVCWWWVVCWYPLDQSFIHGTDAETFTVLRSGCIVLYSCLG